MTASPRPLIQLTDDVLSHGTVFRFPAAWPYEAMVDLMLFDNPDEERPHGLMVTTGQKAGLILVLLPPESAHPQRRGVRTEWLVTQWGYWVYPECPVEQVQVLRRYPAPVPNAPAMPDGTR